MRSLRRYRFDKELESAAVFTSIGMNIDPFLPESADTTEHASLQRSGNPTKVAGGLPLVFEKSGIERALAVGAISVHVLRLVSSSLCFDSGWRVGSPIHIKCGTW